MILLVFKDEIKFKLIKFEEVDSKSVKILKEVYILSMFKKQIIFFI